MPDLKQVLTDIIHILSPREKKRAMLLSVADLGISILDISFLFALVYLLQLYAQPVQANRSNEWVQQLFTHYPFWLISIFFVLFAVKSGAGFQVAKWQCNFVYGVASRLSGAAMLRYLEGEYHDFVQVDSSVVLRKINQQPIEFTHYVLHGIQQIFSQAVLVLLTIITLLFFKPLLFPLLILLLLPPVILTGFMMKRKLHAAGVQVKKTSEKSIQHLQEALAGFIESNTYHKNNFFAQRYHCLQEQLNQSLSEKLVIQQIPPRLMEVFAVFGLTALILFQLFAGRQPVQLAGIGALMAAAYKIIPGIVKITNLLGHVKTYSFAVTDILQQEEKENNRPASNVNSQTLSPCKVQSIVFDAVSFSYPDRNVFSSFSCCIKKGEFVILSAASGRGKTSFIHLLLGFLSPSGGRVLINGACVNSMAQQHWADIAYTKQQVFLLHAPLIENIVLQQNVCDKDKLHRVAALTGLDCIAGLLPDGLHSMVTENGKNFSGGQRQRIVFARALYKDAGWLILDEPFAELDERAEQEMLETLKRINQAGTTVVLLTHNKAAFAYATRKIDIDG